MDTTKFKWIESEEWLDWYRLSPAQRWVESGRMMDFFLMAGGSLDVEPDTQSPFYFKDAQSEAPADGRTGVRFLRRGGI